MSIRVGSIHAQFDGSTLDAYLDDELNIYSLREVGLDVDTEIVPLLVGVGWSGDHTRRAQVHLPAYLDVDPGTGQSATICNYDRLELIDAAILALQRTRDAVARTNGG